MSGSMNLSSKFGGPDAAGIQYHGFLSNEIKSFCKKYDITVTDEGDHLGIRYVRPYGDEWDAVVPKGQWIIVIGEHVFVYNDHFIQESYEF